VSASLLGVPGTSDAAPLHTGTVKVLSAGSFSNVVTLLAAAFKKDTGYTIQDTSEGSSAIASGIVAKTLQGDVFISASTAADTAIEGTANGNWINGYSWFGTSPIALAYYPKSRFASALKKRPWYDVIQDHGFHLGRTDPTVDPGGVLAIDALDGIGYAYNIPPLLQIATASGTIYSEDAIPGLLQAGQLDAGFMYAISADAAKLPYVPLTGTKNLYAQYTVAKLNGAPDPAPATAFVKWLLHKRGLAIMEKQGLVPVAPARVVPAA
jgi:molybdate/tungstate transport system substrate-binding protein